MDIIKEVIDEIALEGLEGITVPGLWTLLSEKQPPILNQDDDDMKSFIWNGILQCNHIEFWLVDKGKKIPVKNVKCSKETQRQDNGNDDIVASKKLPKGWISDPENKIFGYCPSYEQRENITEHIREDKISLKDAWKNWQENLYIVGSISLRNSALFGDETPHNLVMTDYRYIFLELIGKTRHNGLMQADFCKYSMDPRSSFHYIKTLIEMGLVTKQKHCFLKKASTNNIQRFIKTNILFLKRFHRKLMTYQSVLEEKMLQVLRDAPGHMMEINDLRDKVDCSAKCFKAMRKHLHESGRIQHIKGGKILNSDDSFDTIPRMSSAVFIQLIEPTGSGNPVEKEDGDGDDDDNDEDDDDGDEEGLYASKCKYQSPQLLLDIPKMQQLNWVIESFKEKGVTIKEFGTDVCLPYRVTRSVIRHFCKRELIKGVATDKARQRVARFISNNYVYESNAFKEITAELHKAKDLEQSEAKVLSALDGEASEEACVSTNANDQEDLKGKSVDSDLSEMESRIFYKTGSMANKQKDVDPNIKLIETPRAKRRQNLLLEKIKELQVIEGANQLYKFILHSEQKLGIKERVCRKSVLRLLERITKDGLIKKFEVLIPYGDDTSVTIIYYCEANVSMEDEVFKTVLNETKFRLRGIIEKRQVRESRQVQKPKKIPAEAPGSDHASLLELFSKNETANNELSDTDEEEYEPVSGTSFQRHQYGYLPRFRRLQILHVYLWQLAYGTSEDAALCADAAAQQREEDAVDFRQEHYGWLTHLQTLPVNRFGEGYFQVYDALAIMPLDIFIKCVGICIRSNTVEKLLNHPQKRYTPLRDLPPRLRNKLFRGKVPSNYKAHLSESMVLLAYMGLLRTAPGKLPVHRMQMIMWVSKDAKLVDTTSSEKGYSHVKVPSNLKSFPEVTFRFSCLRDISKYWRELQCICLNTRLGLLRSRRSKTDPGDSEGGASKSIRSSKSLISLKELQEDYQYPDSDVPPQLYGDGLGAAGLDTTFYGHLPKNWSNSDARKKHYTALHDKVSSAVLEQRIPAPLGGFTRRLVNSVVTKATIGGKVRKRKRVFDNKIISDTVPTKVSRDDGILTGKPDTKHAERLSKGLTAKYQQKLAKNRKLGKKEKNPGHRMKVDEVDLAAMQRKRTMRVKFCKKEDTGILIARVTANLLGLDARNIRYWPTIRDVLHEMYPESCDKTTESLCRRSRTLFKNPLTNQNFRSCILECKTDPNLIIEQPNTEDDSWKTAFNELFPVVLERFQTRLDMNELDDEELPITLKELKEKFKLKFSFESNVVSDTHMVPTRKEVVLCSLEQLVHNSLVSRNSSEHMSSLVFHVFNQFPEVMLEEAMLKMKKKGIVTRLRVKVPRRRALPISTMTFSLSVLYARLFELPLPIDLFREAGIISRLIRNGGKHSDCHMKYKSRENESERGDNAGEETFSNNENKESEQKENLSDENHIEEEARSQNDQFNESNPRHYGSASVVSSSSMEPFIYSQDNCAGGHVAGILSLFITGRAGLDMEIPDKMLDVDQSLVEDEIDNENQQGTGMVTFLKRKIYSQNVEDALSLHEAGTLSIDDANDEDNDADKVDEDEDLTIDDDYDDDDDDDNVGDDEDNRNDGDDGDDNDDVGTGNNDVIDIHTSSAGDNAILETSKAARRFERGRQYQKGSFVDSDNKGGESSMKPDCLVTPKRSCLKAKTSKPEEDKNFLPKKRRKVVFNEPDLEPQNSPTCSNDVPDEDKTSGPAVSSIETYQGGTKRGASLINESGVESEIPCKKSKFDREMENRNYSGSLTHKLRTSSGNVFFLSCQSFFDKFAENPNGRGKHSSLSSEFSYVDNEKYGGAKGSLAIVPKRTLDVAKTKLHASRITLLLHRSIDQESEYLKKRLCKSMEQMVLNPIGISIHFTPPPLSGNGIESLTDEIPGNKMATRDCVDDGKANEKLFPYVELSTKECEKLDRFMKTEPVTYENSELNTHLSANDIRQFCTLMVASFGWNESEVTFASEILDTIVKAKEHGLTEEEIELVYQKYRDLKPLEEILQMFINFRLTLRVGMHSRRFVAFGLASDWCFTTSLGSIDKEASNDILQSGKDLSEETKEKRNGLSESVAVKSDLRYHQTVCKPWLKLDGEYNISLLQKFQRSVLVLIMTCPGITESTIHGHFCPILTRVALKDILEFLELNDCITKHLSNRRRKPALFDSTEKAVEVDVLNNDPYYTPKIDCILNISD